MTRSPLMLGGASTPALPPPTTRVICVVSLLSFLGGYADAGAYVLTSVFTGHLTGNCILAAVHMAKAEWGKMFVSALAVVAFVGATAAAGRCTAGEVGLNRLNRLRRPLLLEITLFVFAVLVKATSVGNVGTAGMVISMSIALGVQNGMLQKVNATATHTTYISGAVTTVASGFNGVSTTEANRRPQWELLRSILYFLLGAICGSILTNRFGLAGFGGVLVPAILASALSGTSVTPITPS